jgi:alpha-1,3-mannosyltransferase
MAFDLGRKFIFYWSVNWKFVPEEVFLSDQWGLALLGLTLAFWLFFGVRKWSTYVLTGSPWRQHRY